MTDKTPETSDQHAIAADRQESGQRAIIVPPGKNADHFGEGVYALVAEDGECLATHVCSHACFAEGDLFALRPERKEMFAAKGITAFVWLADSGLTLEELTRRSYEFAADRESEKP